MVSAVVTASSADLLSQDGCAAQEAVASGRAGLGANEWWLGLLIPQAPKASSHTLLLELVSVFLFKRAVLWLPVTSVSFPSTRLASAVACVRECGR